MMKHVLTVFALSLALAAFGNGAWAQTTQASISGTITDAQKEPLPGATITVKNESTGFTTRTAANAQGFYSFKELPLGGPYTVKVQVVGFGEQTRNGYQLNQGDAVRVNLAMQQESQNLQVVQVDASGLKNKTENMGAATTISARDMTKLPVNGRNFTTLTDLSPLARGGTISGQLGSSTNYTIDGMTAKNPTSAGSTTSRSGAPYSISIEAVREFKVVTNQYDVTFGRAGGGTVSAVTKSGTNTFSGSAFTYGRANWLSSPYDIRGNRRNVDFSTFQSGFSLGGPIIKDKLHFFVALDHQDDSRPLIIADVQSPADEARFRVSQGTLNQFLDIARSKYGVASSPQFGTFDKKRGSDAAFARIDWQINDRNLLTIRDNYTNDRNRLGLEDNTSINLYESYGDDKNVDNSLLATLRSSITPKLTNELKLQHLYTYQQSSPGSQLPAQNIPRAIVNNVETKQADGSSLFTNIQLGGHRFAQEGFTNNVVQLVDNLYYTTDKVRYTFGVDVMYTRARSVYGSEVNGRFVFANAGTTTALQNFDNLVPNQFYREVPLVDDQAVRSTIWNTGIYGQLQTTLAKGLNMTAGLRIDYSKYPSAPYNEQVFNEVGIRTDNPLSLFLVQPRLQMDWNIGENNTDYIRFGAGIFASDINNYVTINNLVFDGKRLATVDVRGADVPVPNFPGYRADPSTAPTLSQFQLPTINTNAADAQVPVIYKANLSYNRFITEKLKVGITGYATLGRHNYMYVDRNMVADPFFRLANEGNRGVYVPAASIPTNNGVADWKQGRISNVLGRVLELNSQGKVNQFAAVIDATWQYWRDGELTISYTRNQTKDNTSYNGNVANTATLSLPVRDDPRDLSVVSYSDNQFRDKLVFYGTLPSFYGVSVGLRFSGIGGTRYSLLAGGNVNGDFVSSSNDLAFVFDRNNTATPEAIRNGLQAILDNPEASPSLKNYITKYSGNLAERNGGINDFYGIFDLRVSKRFKFYKTHGIEISAELFNVANLFNKEWGVNKSLGNQALYALTGFDAANLQYNYRVNNTGIVNPSGNPYQFQIGLRYGF
ncbi:MAG: TonB-dependent receptor [Mucilaginibacter polytrichastri]|nr:TonB-dependent receptor [Mucilaginibacter polytrichastri]